MRKRGLAMVRHSPQEVADFFGVYVAQDNEGKWWNLFSDKPQLESNCWYAELGDGGVDYGIDITDFINAPANHDWRTLYEPHTYETTHEKRMDSAPHQSEVHTHREYVLLGEFSPSELCVKVSEYLEKGFKLYGYPWTGPDCGRCGYIHYQAMVRGLE